MAECRVDSRNTDWKSPATLAKIQPSPIKVSPTLSRWMDLSHKLALPETDESIKSCGRGGCDADTTKKMPYLEEVCAIDNRSTDTQAAVWVGYSQKQVHYTTLHYNTVQHNAPRYSASMLLSLSYINCCSTLALH